MQSENPKENQSIEKLSESLSDIFRTLIDEAGDKPLNSDVYDGLDLKIKGGLEKYLRKLSKNN